MNYPYYYPFAFTGGLPFPFQPPLPLLWYQGYPMPGPVPFPYHEQPLKANDVANKQGCSRPLKHSQDATAHQNLQHEPQGPPMHVGLHGLLQAPSPTLDYTGPTPFKQNVCQGTPQAATGPSGQTVSNAVMLARHAVLRHFMSASPQAQVAGSNQLFRSDPLLPPLSSQDIQKTLSTKSSVTQAQELLLAKRSLVQQPSVQNIRQVVHDAVPNAKGLMTQDDKGDKTLFKASMDVAPDTKTDSGPEDPFLEYLKTVPSLDGYEELMHINEFRQIGPDTEIITFQQELESALKQAQSFKPVGCKASTKPDEELKTAMQMMCDDYM